MSTTQGPATADVAPLKDIQRYIWSQGDYREIARENQAAADAIVDALDPAPGQELLDVAAGNGNVAVAAARRGARVVASDLTPRMVDWGRARTAAEGLEVDWVQADAEDLPFADDRFDAVASSFGAMFAPRPAVAASELVRVVRPGGRVALANWTPESFVGRLIVAMAAHLPAPPAGVPRPIDWGDERTARARLEPLAADVTITRHAIAMRHASVDEMLAFSERNNGPAVAAIGLLGDRAGLLRSDVRRVIEEANHATDGSVAIDAEYLLVVARKPG